MSEVEDAGLRRNCLLERLLGELPRGENAGGTEGETPGTAPTREERGIAGERIGRARSRSWNDFLESAGTGFAGRAAEGEADGRRRGGRSGMGGRGRRKPAGADLRQNRPRGPVPTQTCARTGPRGLFWSAGALSRPSLPPPSPHSPAPLPRLQSPFLFPIRPLPRLPFPPRRRRFRRFLLRPSCVFRASAEPGSRAGGSSNADLRYPYHSSSLPHHLSCLLRPPPTNDCPPLITILAPSSLSSLLSLCPYICPHSSSS